MLLGHPSARLARDSEGLEEAPFLDAGQKRDILYNNAAGFLRLDRATIDRHHREAAETAPAQAGAVGQATGSTP